MGIGFPRTPPLPDADGRHLFIRGNHDSPGACRSHPRWVADGTTVDGMYCLGGAVSIDRVCRTEGFDWWADEECSYADLERMIDEYAAIKPEIVITHDYPESIADLMLCHLGRRKFEEYGSRTRQALERMFHLHQPRQWFFGHWHTSLQFKSGRTMFRCLNELEAADVEL